MVGALPAFGWMRLPQKPDGYAAHGYSTSREGPLTVVLDSLSPGQHTEIVHSVTAAMRAYEEAVQALDANELEPK